MTGRMIGSVKSEVGLFILEADFSANKRLGQVSGLECYVESKETFNKNDIMILWNYKLGHLSISYLKNLF